MMGLLQRVSEAGVTVGGEEIASIGRGLLVLVGVERGDTEAQADRLLERLLGYRIFPDADDKMNCSLQEIGGGLLLVPQFTLAADTRKGMRPSFGSCAEPAWGLHLFDYLLQRAWEQHGERGAVQSGRFGADMQVRLINAGPVTFHLHVPPP